MVMEMVVAEMARMAAEVSARMADALVVPEPPSMPAEVAARMAAKPANMATVPASMAAVPSSSVPAAGDCNRAGQAQRHQNAPPQWVPEEITAWRRRQRSHDWPFPNYQ